MDSQRTYSKDEVRERQLTLQRQLDMNQRELDALAKLEEARDALEQLEREREASDRGEARPVEPVQAVPSAPPDPEPQAPEPQVPQPQVPQPQVPQPQAEPETIGPRALVILKDHADNLLSVRMVLGDMKRRGWVDDDTDDEHMMQRLRHCLPRLVRNNEHVEANKDGATYLYRYVSPGASGEADR